jgi:hypothetical protein
MGRRALPALLVLAAAVADATGSHGLARTAVLLAIPFAAVAGLECFGDYLDSGRDGVVLLHALLWSLALVLLLVSSAVRSHALHGVPPLAASSLIACLGVLGVKAALVASPYARRALELRPVKP